MRKSRVRPRRTKRSLARPSLKVNVSDTSRDEDELRI